MNTKQKIATILAPQDSQQASDFLYHLVQLSPCILVTFVALGKAVFNARPAGFATLLVTVSLALIELLPCAGLAALFALFAPKQHRNYVMGLFYCLFETLFIVFGG